MPRTRGQEVKLVEKGIPTTPPQQLPTPRRTTKANMRTRKSRETVVAPPGSSQPARPRARTTRARTTSASQTDTQLTQTTRASSKRQGRTAKSSKATQSTDEEVIVEAPPVLEPPQEHTEEDSSQAEQLVPRENPSLKPLVPNSPSPFVHSQASPTLPDVSLPPGAPSPKDVKPVTKADAEADVTSVPEDDYLQKEPGHFETNSSLSGPKSPGLPKKSPQDQLMEIIRNTMPVFLAMLHQHPEIKNNASLEHLLTEGEVSVSMKPPNQKRKIRLASQPVDQAGKASEDAPECEKETIEPIARSASKRKSLETEQDAIENGPPKRLRVSLERTKRVPVLFDENGMLSLRAYKEVPIKEGSSSEEETGSNSVKPLDGVFSQDQQRSQHHPETPRSRGWALSGLLPSAQTVTKYLPSFSRRTPAVVSALPNREPNLQDQPVTPTPNATGRPQGEVAPINPFQTQNDDRSVHSEPRLPVADSGKGRNKEQQSSATVRPYRRHRHSKSKRGLKTKGEKEEIRRRDELIASLRAQLEAQNESQSQKEAHAEKAAQAQLEISAQIGVEASSTAQQASGQTSKNGLKRKATSPKQIPNPSGGGYGMVLEYFGQDSDDDDDEGNAIMGGTNNQVTPTQPPSKKVRLSDGPTPTIVGSPFRATPYTGTALALPPLPTEPADSHDLFLETNMDEDTEGHLPVPTATPPNGPTLTFTVPSPGDSDSEWDGTSYVEESSTAPATAPADGSGVNHNDESTQASIPNAARTQTPPTSLVPQQSSSLKTNFLNLSGSTTPQTTGTVLFPMTWKPLSSDAYRLPSAPVLPNVALDKARQTALKHKPQQPSRLRESSRLSTSTVGTEVDEDEVSSKVNEKNLPNSSTETANVTRAQDDLAIKGHHEQSRPNNETSKGQEYLQQPESRDPYAGREMRQSPSDPMLLEPIPVPHESSPPFEDGTNINGEYSTDNTASDQDLPEDAPVFNSYGAYEKTLTPRVKDYLSRLWDEEKSVMGTETPPASQLRSEACTVITDQFNEYEKQRDKPANESQVDEVPEAMHDYIESIWNASDTQAAIEKFDQDFEAYVNQPIE